MYYISVMPLVISLACVRVRACLRMRGKVESRKSKVVIVFYLLYFSIAFVLLVVYNYIMEVLNYVRLHRGNW